MTCSIHMIKDYFKYLSLFMVGLLFQVSKLSKKVYLLCGLYQLCESWNIQ